MAGMKRKTHAFATDRSRKQSGWASDRMLYSTVPARTILRSTENSFTFDSHNFDEPGVKGSYNASHVEPQALYDAREDAAILVTRPMCKSCRKFVLYIARAKNINVHVGTPEGIVTVSRTGSFGRTELASGTTSAGIRWEMSHERARGRTSMRLNHPNAYDGQTEIFVSGSSEGPVAVEEHRHGDGLTETSTYFENKEVDIQSRNIGGPQYSASTLVGPSGGVRDSLTYGDHTTGHKREPREFLGFRS